MDTTLVSVIIPNFNYAEFLEGAIESVLNQTFQQLEVIVVDDGSTDNSLEVLARFDGRVKIVESRNRGSCAARNLGILHGSGDYFAFLDADDVWDSRKIELELKHLLDANSDLVFCNMRTLEETGIETKGFHLGEINHQWFLRNPGSTPFPPSTALLTRELAARVGGWNTSLTGPAEDFDFFRRCAKFGKITQLDEVLVSHRQHSKSLTSSNLKRYFEDNVRALRIMLQEDRIFLGFIGRIKAWHKLHLKFMKHAIKVKNAKFLMLILRSFFNY